MDLVMVLEKLKLDHLALQLDRLCEQAAERELDYRSFLTEALAVEWQGRDRRGIETRLRQSRFPWMKTLDQYDFEYQPSVDRRQIRELAGLGFVHRAQNIVILGPPGVGKTHLAIAVAVKAVEAGFSALFLTLEELMTRLVRAKNENRLDRILQQLSYPKVLVIDEIGYLPLSREEASLFFRLVVRRDERASMIVTSNKSFLDWGDVFNDHVLATAILDRLLHHATTVNIKGESYRLKEKRRAGMLLHGPPPLDERKEVPESVASC